MDLNVAQLQVDPICMMSEVAACVSCADIQSGGAEAVRLRSNYDGSPPVFETADETSDRSTATEGISRAIRL